MLKGFHELGLLKTVLIAFTVLYNVMKRDVVIKWIAYAFNAWSPIQAGSSTALDSESECRTSIRIIENTSSHDLCT